MTDEEMAEKEYENCKFEKVEHYCDKSIYVTGFLASLKAGRPQWHKVKDGNPDNGNDILCQISKDEVEVGYYHTKQKRYYTIDGQPIDVIRWQEIVFPKESE